MIDRTGIRVTTVFLVGFLLGGVTLAEAPSVALHDIFTSGVGGYHTYRIPALVVTPRGTLLAFCEGRKTSRRDDGDIDLLMRRSVDEGQSWEPAGVVHEEGGDAAITIGNPCPVVDQETGTVHLLFTRDNLRAFHTASEDDGKTWSSPIEITAALRDFAFPWTRIGTGPGHGIQLAGGRLVVPVWLNERKGTNYRSAVVISDDQGKTWLPAGLVSGKVPDTNECMVAAFPDGSLYLSMRAQDIPFRHVSRSLDEGKTWTGPVRDEDLPGPVCQASVLVGANGALYLAGPAGAGRRGMTVRRSDDRGEHWVWRQAVWTGPSAYSDLAWGPSGALIGLCERGMENYYEKISFFRIPRE